MSEIESKVKAIIVDKLGVDEAEVKPEASFTNAGYRRAHHGVREGVRYLYPRRQG